MANKIIKIISIVLAIVVIVSLLGKKTKAEELDPISNPGIIEVEEPKRKQGSIGGFFGGIIDNFRDFIDDKKSDAKKVILKPFIWGVNKALSFINTGMEYIEDSLINKKINEIYPNAYNKMISISDTLILPIGGLLYAFILTYELIRKFTDQNNYQEFLAKDIFEYIFKLMFGAYLILNVGLIISFIFDLGQNLLKGAVEMLDISSVELSLEEFISDEEVLEAGAFQLIIISILGLLSIIGGFLGFIMLFFTLITRVFEIYLYIAFATIPIATLFSKEFNHIGINFIKNLIAYALQGLVIVLVLALYSYAMQGFKLEQNFLVTVGLLAGINISAVMLIKKSKAIILDILN